MDKTKRLPIVSPELLAELEARFPDRMPDHTQSHQDISFKCGQVSVVRFLRSAFEAQTKNILEKK